MRLPRSLLAPARLLPLTFLVVILGGALLLSLPISTSAGDRAPFVVALFTSTSAVCVTGLVVVDTGAYWSVFGQVVIMGLIQTGGFGIVTLSTLLAILISRRLGVAVTLVVAAERRSLGIGDVRRVVLGVAAVMLTVEFVVAVCLTLRLALAYDEPWHTALWQGVFHAISAFNSAGFVLWDGGMLRFVSDVVICMSISLAIVIASLGFPVIFELLRDGRTPSKWSIHTRLTVWATGLLLTIAVAAMLLLEWNNPLTLGPLTTPDKWLAGWFQAVQPRSAGFNTVDVGAMYESTWSVWIALMFVGGGSAGTAGGIKVTTFMLLGAVILAEVRGDRDVTVGRRRVAHATERQALAIALIGVGLVAVGTLALELTSPFGFSRTVFEVTSAFGTVGLSTGITPMLEDRARVVLIVLMFVGRVGPVTAASLFALRNRQLLYRYPEERPLVG